jgi:hypothetical protein
MTKVEDSPIIRLLPLLPFLHFLQVDDHSLYLCCVAPLVPSMSLTVTAPFTTSTHTPSASLTIHTYTNETTAGQGRVIGRDPQLYGAAQEEKTETPVNSTPSARAKGKLPFSWHQGQIADIAQYCLGCIVWVQKSTRFRRGWSGHTTLVGCL